MTSRRECCPSRAGDVRPHCITKNECSQGCRTRNAPFQSIISIFNSCRRLHLYPSVRTTRVSKLLGGAKAFLNARYAWPHGWPRCERSMERKAHAFVGEITVAIIPVALRQISRNTCTQTNKPNDTRGSVPRRCARPRYILHVPIHDTPMKSTPD